MKKIQWLLLLIAALSLVACTALGSNSSLAPTTAHGSAPSQGFASPQAVPSFTPSPSPQPVSPTPAPTPIPLCPQTSSEVGWQCQENRLRHTRTCGPATSSEPTWACYEDLIYGFAVEYPVGVNVEIPIDTKPRSDVKIARRHSLWGPLVVADVDIWHPSAPDLTRWLERMRGVTGPDLVPFTQPNARVAGYPAVAFVMGDPQSPSPMFTVYLSNGIYGYRLWFTLQCDREQVARIRRMLDTFRFSAQAVPAEIPEEVWQEVRRAFGPPRCAPLPPTPGLSPTPRPVVLPAAQEAEQLTKGWELFESPVWGIRFRYPADYQVQMQESPGWTTFSISRPGGDFGQETFLGLFLWKYEGPPVETAEALLKWESGLPPEVDPVGGRMFVTGDLDLPKMGKAWTIRWEPLPGNSEVVVDSVAIPAKGRMIWINLARPVGADQQLEDAIWPLQMAFLATLEVTR